MSEEKNSKSDFVASRKQIKRMARIVALLKLGDRTGAEMLRDLDESSTFGTTDISCSPRTLRHDIEVLKNEYNCPVCFNYSSKRYEMYNKSWDFTLPTVLNRNELLAIVIGGKFSQDILPKELSRGVADAVDEVVRSNESGDYLSGSRLESLKILTCAGEPLGDRIFSTVFEAWRLCRRLRIEYQGKDDGRTERIIEPHALVFHDMQWGIKGFCPDTKEWRTFLVARIAEAYPLPSTFVPDDDAIRAISPDNFFKFPDACDATLRLTKNGVRYAKAHPLRQKQQIDATEDGGFLLHAPNVSYEDVRRWTLSQVPGDAIPVSPKHFVEKLADDLQKLQKLCGK